MQNIHHFTKWCFLLQKFGKIKRLLGGLIIWNVKKIEIKLFVLVLILVIIRACAAIVLRFIENVGKYLVVSFPKMQKRRIIEVSNTLNSLLQS